MQLELDLGMEVNHKYFFERLIVEGDSTLIIFPDFNRRDQYSH